MRTVVFLEPGITDGDASLSLDAPMTGQNPGIAVFPAEGKEVRFTFSNLVESETECKAQVVIADEASVYTKMSLTFRYEPV